MARTRRPRLSWVRWFWSDFDGGTKLFSDAEAGQYLRLLHLQLDSGKLQAFPFGKDTRCVLTSKPSARVLAKFDPVEVEGIEMLRNIRMAEEAWSARDEVGAKGWRKGVPADDDTPTKSQPKDDDTSHSQNHSHPHPYEPAPEPTSTDSAPPAQALAKPLPKKQRGGYVARACDLWTEIKGGVVAYGRMGNALKPLLEVARKHHPRLTSDAEAWEKIEPWFRSYLETTDDGYCSPEAFAKAPRSGVAGSAKARARDEAMLAGIQGGLRDE